MGNRFDDIQGEIPVHRFKDEDPSFYGATPAEVTGFGHDGKDIDPTTDRCLAKKVFDPDLNARTYFLKFATEGPDRGRLYNPVGLFTDTQTSLARGAYQFRKVPVEKFDLYIHFLKTGNPAHFRQAERIR